MSDSTRKGPPSTPAPPDGEEPAIAPLSHEERRKLFDLPEPAPAAKAPLPPTPRHAEEAPLELERDGRAAAVEKAVTRIRVGRAGAAGCAVAILRLAVVGLVAGVAMFAGLRFVFRG